MLSVASVTSADYYTKGSYYSDQEVSLSTLWAGNGAELLELSGDVDAKAFSEILSGNLPDGSALGVGPDGTHRLGTDLTFSAPKSLSLLAYVAGDTRLLDAHKDAVLATLAWAEQHFAETRMEIDGKIRPVKTGNLAIALFEQDTSRSLDPQAHIHAVVANATKGPDGKWRTLHNDKLWANNALLGTIYHANLREGVAALGYTTEPTGKHGQFEIQGIAREGIEAFSTRANDIRAVAEQLGTTNPKALDTIALKTRPRKAEPDRADLLSDWKDRAAAAGLDLAGVVETARERLAIGAKPWSQAVEGVRGAVARAGAIAQHFAARIGLAERDPLASKPLRTNPREIAAEQAVGAAVRQISEREASFTTYELTKTALDLGLPITVRDVERQTRRLVRSGALIAGVDEDKGRLTTRDAVQIETKILEVAARGRGAVLPIVVSPEVAGARVQAAAEAGQGFRLNEGQEGAARILLASTSRIVAVQGVAGSGKSSVLKPVAEIAREEGRTVLALGPQNTLVQMLGRDTGIKSQTIASFIRRYESLLLPNVAPGRIDRARTTMKDAIVLVDESSMVSNDQALRLVLIAEKLDLGRLALVMDKRQLGAVGAGKPGELLQSAGIETAVMSENLRARGPAIKAAAELANQDQSVEAFRALASFTTEAAGKQAEVGIGYYLARSPEERAKTVLLASGRRFAGEMNDQVQQGLKAEGSLSGSGLALTVHVKVTTTREEERFKGTYAPGLFAEFPTGLPSQSIPKGTTARIDHVDQKTGRVTMIDTNGRRYVLDPQRLPTNRSENTLRLTDRKELRIYEGDRVRFTDTDRQRGLFNADTARVKAIDANGVTLETSSRLDVTLPHGDKMLGRIDLGYALNAHPAQGITADRAIAVFDSREKNLTNQKLFLVQITRVRDDVRLVVDNSVNVARSLSRNEGSKSAALEITGGLGGPIAAPSDRRGAQPASAPTPAPEPSPIVRIPPTATIPSAPAATPIEQPKPTAPRPQTKAPVPQKQLELDM